MRSADRECTRLAGQADGYRCIMCLNDKQRCMYGNVPALHSKSKPGVGSTKISRRSAKRPAPLPSPSPPPASVSPTANSSIVVRRALPSSAPPVSMSPSSIPPVVLPPRKKKSNLSSYRDPIAENSADFSPLSGSLAMSSLLFDSDVASQSGRPSAPPLSAASSSSSEFDLRLMKIQLRASQEDLRSVREQLARLEATRQAEVEAYRRRVEDLEFEKRQGFSGGKGKGRGV